MVPFSMTLIGSWLGFQGCDIYTLHAKLSGAVYCYRSCLWLWCLQWAGGRCPNLTTASACAVYPSLWALFSFPTVNISETTRYRAIVTIEEHQ